MIVLEWLLDADPAIRWQVLHDLTDAPAEQVRAERDRVATEGWGAELLARRDPDGQWAGGACFPADFTGDFSAGQPWTSTLPTLTLLRDLGVDPGAPVMRETVQLVAAQCHWEYDGAPFFAGEVEPCINGRTVAVGAYFGADVSDISGIVERLLGEQLADGGWNCEAENGSVRSSFHTTIDVLDGLREFERTVGGSPAIADACARGEEYLLDRALFRRRSTGEVVDPAFLQFSFPTWWHYDVLRGLDHFRQAAATPDPRLADALDVLRGKRQADGRWLLENTHHGSVHIRMEEGDGTPSRWNTLRALRVLRWADRNGG